MKKHFFCTLRSRFFPAANDRPALSLRSVRPAAVPFIAGWVIVFTWLSCSFLPAASVLFAVGAPTGWQRASAWAWLVACPLLALLADGSFYVPKTLYSVLAALACYALQLALPAAAPPAQVALALCAGHIFVSCGFGFFLVLNNAEKFCAMLLAVFASRAALAATSGLTAAGPLLARTLPGVCLGALLVCAVFFRRSRLQMAPMVSTSFPKRAWSLMAVVFVMFTLCDVVAPLMLVRLQTPGRVEQLWYFAGACTGLALVLGLQQGLRLSLARMLDLAMALLAAGFVCGLTAARVPAGAAAAAACFGAAYGTGMVNVYYLAGLLTKKLQSLPFYRAGIVLSSLCYLCGFALVRLFSSAPEVLCAVCIFAVLAFFVFSPLLLRLLYSREWLDDACRADVTFESRLRTRLRERGLSPKECEVCEHLLQGFTLRQTAAMMKVAYPTANTYCTALYRKLNINSRTELTLLFRDFLD